MMTLASIAPVRTEKAFSPPLVYVDRETIKILLQQVEKPGRYVGGEFGIPDKRPEDYNVRVLLSYPDVYELGMTNEGLKILYDQIHKNGYFADRAFLPWHDFGELLKAYRIPLYSLDHFLDVRSFDVWGFNVAHELHFTNILYALDLAGIPLLRKDRVENEPIILCGGTAVTNPLPLFDFVDGIFMGDGEEGIIEILRVIDKAKREGKTRKEILHDLRDVEGLVLPEFYEISVGDQESYPEYSGKLVRKRTYKADEFANLDYIVVPNIEITQDRAVIEVNRGCGNGCRFCHAGFWKRPVRNATVDRLIEIAGKILRKTGHNTLTLHSLSIADYPWLEELVIGLARRYGPEGISLSLPSLRVQVKTIPILEMTSDIRKSSITFALEAGSEFLREKIHKKASEENLHYLMELVYEKGWDVVKVYFMLGLPDYEGREVEDLIRALNTLGKIAEKHGKRKKVNVSVSLFVPKPFTTFQWEEQKSPEYFENAIRRIKNEVRSRRVWIRHPSPWMAYIEGLLSRSDHRIGPYLLEAYRRGARFDSWDDGFREDIWKGILEEIPVAWKNLWLNKKPVETVLPWERIVDGVPREKLLRDYGKFLSINEKNMNPAKKQVLDPSKFPEELFQRVSIPEEKFRSRCVLYLQFAKVHTFLYVSYFETIEVLRKAMRRSGFPLTFTRGYNKIEKIQISDSLPLYIYSLREEIVIHFYRKREELDLEKLKEDLRKNVPKDLYILDIRGESLQDDWWKFRLEFKNPGIFSSVYERLLSPPEVLQYEKETGKDSRKQSTVKEIKIKSLTSRSKEEFLASWLEKFPEHAELVQSLFEEPGWDHGLEFQIPRPGKNTVSIADLVTYYLGIPKSRWNLDIRIIKI